MVSQSCFLKLFPKAIAFQSNCPSMLLSKPQSCSPQLLPKVALQSCYRKPRPKNAPQNSNVVTRSCLKAGPESCPKLLPKAAAQSCSPALLPKVVPQSCSPKLLKAAPQTCYQKLLSKAIAPKLQLFKPIPPNGSPKLFCKAAPESCSRKLLLKAAPRSCL